MSLLRNLAAHLSLFCGFCANLIMVDPTPPPQRKRLPSVIDGLPNGLQLDVRAHQRTYEGAYTRSSLGSLTFAILVIKLFSLEFLPLGIVYTIYGCLLYFIGVYKAASVDFYYNPERDMTQYKTSGNTVLLLTGISLASYISLLVLILRMS